MRVQFWLFVSAMAGFIVAAITLLVTSHGGFISDYNSFARPFTHHANTYSYFMAQAKSGGINVHAPTNWHNTIIASIKKGDPDATEAALVANWVNGSNRLAEVIASQGERGTW